MQKQFFSSWIMAYAVPHPRNGIVKTSNGRIELLFVDVALGEFIVSGESGWGL